ncbi:MAG: ATP-binding cassette domain-containing protein [Pseudomonadales bacterium]|nr:ATP-binding cassette domain-containing protein [Pseudomonadales bacterium]
MAVPVLQGLELEAAPGDTIGIMGSSGSGKSTLLNLIGGLDRPDAGSVELLGRDLGRLSDRELARARNRHLGFVYQFHHLLAEFSALENAAMPLLIAGIPRVVARRQGAELLAAVGLGHRLDHRPGALSGGERQRVAIARALANRPDCVLMDEPTGNLDRRSAEQVVELLLRLNAELGTTFVVVSHDERVAGRMGRLLVLEDGRLRDAGP